MSKFLNHIQHDMDKLQKNDLLNSPEKIKFDQKIKLSEPNRRALNLLLDLKNRQITTLTLLKACLFREVEEGIIEMISLIKIKIGNVILDNS